MIITEVRRGGSRGSSYAYFLVENELVHISEVGRLVSSDDMYVYEVPSNAINYFFVFDFSRSGYPYLRRCPPGDYKESMDFTKCEGKNIDDAVRGWLANVRFRTKNKELKQLLDDLSGEFTIMANEVKSYWTSLGGRLRLMGRSARLGEFFSDPRIYYFSELSIPNDAGRVRGIKTVMSLIYENWVAAKVAEALGAKRLKRRRWEEGPVFADQPVTVWFEQGSGTSYAILDASHGLITMWVEFQESPEIHVFLDADVIKVGDGLKYVRSPGRKAVRPDIVIVKGEYDTVNEFLKSGKDIDLLIECKVMPYNEWRKDVEEQVIPYMDRFKPRNMLLVSKHEVPNSVKVKLGKHGVNVVDDIRPGGREAEELGKRVQEALG